MKESKKNFDITLNKPSIVFTFVVVILLGVFLVTLTIYGMFADVEMEEKIISFLTTIIFIFSLILFLISVKKFKVKIRGNTIIYYGFLQREKVFYLKDIVRVTAEYRNGFSFRDINNKKMFSLRRNDHNIKKLLKIISER